MNCSTSRAQAHRDAIAQQKALVEQSGMNLPTRPRPKPSRTLPAKASIEAQRDSFATSRPKPKPSGTPSHSRRHPSRRSATRSLPSRPKLKQVGIRRSPTGTQPSLNETRSQPRRQKPRHYEMQQQRPGRWRRPNRRQRLQPETPRRNNGTRPPGCAPRPQGNSKKRMPSVPGSSRNATPRSRHKMRPPATETPRSLHRRPQPRNEMPPLPHAAAAAASRGTRPALDAIRSAVPSPTGHGDPGQDGGHRRARPGPPGTRRRGGRG